MGIKLESKTSGPITCVTMIPPPNLAQAGFGTTCTVKKPPMFAVIEVSVNNEKDMVPLERLRGVAEKMAGRF